MTVGEFIKQKRIAKGLTIERLSQLCNSNDSAFSRIENNKRDIEFSLLTTLCKVLDFTPNELAESTGFSVPPSDPEPFDQELFEVKKQAIKDFMKEFGPTMARQVVALHKIGTEYENLPENTKGVKISTAKLPLVSGVKCGAFTVPAEETFEMISVPESWAEVADFIIQVSGDSMEQYHIIDGLFVAIKKQNTCSPGDIVLLCNYDETDISKGVLKKVKNINNIGLVFMNGTGDIIPMSESYRIEGVAVKWGML